MERARSIYITIGSNDIERSKRFYDAVLATLGAGEPVRNKAGTGHVRLFYRHNGSTFCITEPINDETATFANGGTIVASSATRRSTSRSFTMWHQPMAACRSRIRRAARR